MPKVSVVLPVYNGENFIRTTISSILNQSFKDFELVVVDDGSTDSSRNILDSISCLDSRVKIIYQKNQGICIARNIGIKESSSDYIMFCDHDDLYQPEYIKNAFNDISESGADFVKYGCREVFVKGNKVIKSNDNCLQDCQFKRSVDILLLYRFYNEYLWDGIYKKSILEKVGGFDPFFKSGCEDLDIFFKILKVSTLCLTKKELFYVHFIRDYQSTSKKFSINALESLDKVYRQRFLLVDKLNSYNFIKYKKIKTKQYVLSVLGMLSFKDCNLRLSEVFLHIKEINKEVFVQRNLSVFLNYDIKNLLIFLFKAKFFKILSFICIIRRKIK